MAEVINWRNRRFYTSILEDMFRMRYRVVVTEWGWKIPDAQDDRDVDQFDTDSTVYFVELDAARRRILACARLNPTTQPHMMTGLFADACDLQVIPQSPTCWECSRFVVDRNAFRDRDEERETRRRVGVGITEYCLSQGISQLSWFTHQAFYNEALKIWDTVPLGRPKYYPDDNAVYIPAVSEIDAQSLARQRRRLVDHSAEVTFELSPLTPALPIDPNNNGLMQC